MKNENTQKYPKLCLECGCEIVEQIESTLYECERCLGTKEE